jgi:hypothetical protein
MKRAQITQNQILGKALARLTGPGEAKPVKNESAENIKVPMIKLSVFLNREEDAYLESLAASAKFSGGKKLSKTKLIEAMVRAFSQTELDMSGVKDNKELLKRVSAQLRL